MDKIHRYWIVFGLMALYVLPATGQDCESLKNKLLETGRSWSIEKGFRVEYEITSFFGDGETQSTVQNIMALGRGDRSYLKADQLEVLKDKSTAVNLVHNRKTVFIADASDPLYRQRQLENLELLQDSVFQQVAINGCEILQGEQGEELYRLELSPQTKAKKLQVIGKLTYTFTAHDLQVREVEVTYAPGYSLLSLVAKFKTIDFSYSGTVFQGSALGQVLTSAGKLKTPYQDYQLLDVRKKSNTP